jgi:hypothetical protein
MLFDFSSAEGAQFRIDSEFFAEEYGPFAYHLAPSVLQSRRSEKY